MIAVCIIATGGEKYTKYVQPLIDSLKRFFPPHEVFLFTDSKQDFKVFTIPQEDFGWPRASLMRYHIMLKQKDLFSRYSHVFYIDADMILERSIAPEEILSDGITAVIHGGFPTSFERRQASAAFVGGNPTYYQGCFFGGSTSAFFDMCQAIATQIDKDDKNGIVAIWYDESHLNHYLIEHSPAIALSPAYAFPEISCLQHPHTWMNERIEDFIPKVRHISKKNPEIWKIDLHNNNNKIICGVWWGPRLTNIQKLCIRSYQDYGHEFHLYTNGPVGGVPEGTVLHLVDEIMASSNRNRFTCESYFSDYFRVALILECGGWYVDLDTICLRAFDFPEPYAFVSESQFGDRLNPHKDPKTTQASEKVQTYLSGCIFKAPKNAPILKYILTRIDRMDTLHPADWIVYGPALFKEAIPKFGLSEHVKAPYIFDAVNYNEMLHFIGRNIKWNISPNSYAIHLRTSAWTGKDGLSPNETFPPDSLFEQLKQKHGVS